MRSVHCYCARRVSKKIMLLSSMKMITVGPLELCVIQAFKDTQLRSNLMNRGPNTM